MTKGIPFAQLIANLRQLCQEQQTGMVFITTDDNQIGQLSLENGNIVYLFFRKQRGEKALPVLRQVKAGHLSFKPGMIPASHSAMPTTEKVLDYLQGAGGQQSVRSVVETLAPRPTRSSAFSEKDKSILLEELTEFIGPMAIIVCQENLQAAHDLDTALDMLSQTLPDASQATRFRTNVLRRVEG